MKLKSIQFNANQMNKSRARIEFVEFYTGPAFIHLVYIKLYVTTAKYPPSRNCMLVCISLTLLWSHWVREDWDQEGDKRLEQPRHRTRPNPSYTTTYFHHNTVASHHHGRTPTPPLSRMYKPGKVHFVSLLAAFLLFTCIFAASQKL